MNKNVMRFLFLNYLLNDEDTSSLADSYADLSTKLDCKQSIGKFMKNIEEINRKPLELKPTFCVIMNILSSPEYAFIYSERMISFNTLFDVAANDDNIRNILPNIVMNFFERCEYVPNPEDVRYEDGTLYSNEEPEVILQMIHIAIDTLVTGGEFIDESVMLTLKNCLHLDTYKSLGSSFNKVLKELEKSKVPLRYLNAWFIHAPSVKYMYDKTGAIMMPSENTAGAVCILHAINSNRPRVTVSWVREIVGNITNLKQIGEEHLYA